MTFPSLVPTSRSVTYGEYPIKSFRSQSGVVVRRLFGDLPGGFKLTLQFQGLAAEQLESLLEHYDSVQGGFTGFTLPDSVWSGENESLLQKYQNLSSVLWHYETPPQVEAIRGIDRRNVSVNLIGDLIGG